MPDTDHVIVGTAGHIDHGKTLLVKALTGIDADTLAEEKRRGITIELGFVFMEAPGYGKQIVFIDVPGHEKLVRTMVAGASNIDLALLVVAADEGVSVQTKEHFEILGLLGVRSGIVALTKADLVPEDLLLARAEEIRGFLAGSFLEGAPILPVSAVDGRGIDELRQTLMDLGARTGPRHDTGIFRMPIDRVFTMKGFGTVVAGTILSGDVREGDRVEVYPDGLGSRVRAVQVHHRRVERSTVGRRTALNLQDIKTELLRRGQTAARPGSLAPTQRLDAELRLLEGRERPLKNRSRVRLHTGTAETIARVVLLESDEVLPGRSAPVQFVLEEPNVAAPGDRFVIRTFSPLATIGGGVILDARPGKHKRFDAGVVEGLRKLGGSVVEAVEQAVRSSGTVPAGLALVRSKIGERQALLEEALGKLKSAGTIREIAGHEEPKFLHEEAYKDLERAIGSALRDYLAKNPQRAAMPREELRAKALAWTDERTLKAVLGGSVEKGTIRVLESGFGLPGHEPQPEPRDREMSERIRQEFRKGGFAPPAEEEVRRKLGLHPREFKQLTYGLLQRGDLVRLSEKVVYDRDSVEKARRVVLQYLEKYPSITVAELRDLLALSRKFATAILEYFDRTGLTKRDKDVHILG